MPTYSISDIVGKTLYAKKVVPLLQWPRDDSQVLMRIQPGGLVGVVDTYFLPSGTDRKKIYWGFVDANGRAYYAVHDTGMYDVESLQGQGILTIQEQIELEQAAESWFPGIPDVPGVPVLGEIKGVLLLAGGVLLLLFLNRR